VASTTGGESAWPDGAGIKINLYGRSGTGKTTLWATFPGPILAVVCSGGKKPGELRSIDTLEYRKKICPVVLQDTDSLADLIGQAPEGGTFVLDHATGLQDLALKEILGLDELPVQKSWGMASQSQYGQLGIKMKEMLRAILSLDCNVVIVAQERNFNEDSQGDVIMPFVASALTPSVVGWLNPAVDYIGETFIRQRYRDQQVKVGNQTNTERVAVKGKVDYCLRTAPDPVYCTKFRLPKGSELPDVIVDPSYEKIRTLIDGAKNSD
jgi:hypothetical protein